MLPKDGHEAVAVCWLQQVHHFVNDNVFQQLRVFGQVTNGSSPRLWGTPAQDFPATCKLGSSPRLWGTLLVVGRAGMHGSSPRLWGTLCTITVFNRLITVHPHACGEHVEPGRSHDANRFIPTPVGNTVLSAVGHQATPGSSPRLWGTLYIVTAMDPTVHPHACGEHLA